MPTRQAGRRHSGRFDGEITFGKTHSDRLRRIDILLVKLFPHLLQTQINSHPDCSVRQKKSASKKDRCSSYVKCIVDLGFGDSPVTLLQTAETVHRDCNPRIRVIGGEIDSKRVRFAQSLLSEEGRIQYRTLHRFHHVDPSLISFCRSGFELSVPKANSSMLISGVTKDEIVVIRCLNVLRQFYDESECSGIHSKLCDRLSHQFGGVLIEGTSDKFGRLWSVNVLNHRRTLLFIVFGTNFKSPSLCPSEFQPFLPKQLIHRVGSEGYSTHKPSADSAIINSKQGCQPLPILSAFFKEWKLSYERTRHVCGSSVSSTTEKLSAKKRHFVAAAQDLATQTEVHGFHIDSRKSLLKKGFLVWKVSPFHKTEDFYARSFPSEPRKNKVR